ncbi:hypothetical protein [Chitinophaga jiangningensis]|nr:hypothetical protein [Chitinophaga jiangningensis]
MPDILIKQAEHKKTYTITKDTTDDAYSSLNEERNGLNEERVEEDTPLSEFLVDRKDPVTIILEPIQHVMGEDTFYLNNHSLELITPPPERQLI